MTTTKDVIRQASLFTMNGIIDPRLMPEQIKATTVISKRAEKESNTFRRLVEKIILFISSAIKMAVINGRG
jgi:hypothetical protein